MRLFEVSTDSTADLYEDYRKKRDIWFAPLSFSFEKDGKIEEYLDNFSEYSQYVDFYNKVRNKYMPRTAMLNYEAHVSHFTAMAKAGVKDVLHFSISSGLARTTQVAKQAAEEVKKEYPDFNMVSVDPLGATILQGMLVTLACDMRDEGKTMQETYEYLTDARNRILCTIIPTDLFYLQRGGGVRFDAGREADFNVRPRRQAENDRQGEGHEARLCVHAGKDDDRSARREEENRGGTYR